MDYSHQYGVERRLTIRMLAYWEKLRGFNEMPQQHDLKPEDIGDLWTDCFIAVARPQCQYDYPYIGDNISDTARACLLQEEACDLLPIEPKVLSAAYAK